MHNVSVVIPARDEEDCIGRCLDRLTAQLESGDEIILLDNGSEDRTAEIADSYDDVRVIDAPDDRFDDIHYRGLSQLRQLGAEEASNEIVATTDADTIPPMDWLDRIRTHFEEDDELSVLWGIVTDTNGVPVRDMTGKYLTFLGGVSGANTAFRKADFEQLKKGYVGWPIFEDVALVTRLARTGKAVHDTGMEMRSDLDRRRYQTLPMLGASGVAVGTGALLGGPVGAAAIGSGVGLAGTELFYEQAQESLPDAPFHHDQAGLALILGGITVGTPVGVAAAGLGSGMIAHHLLTEGASALPTDLMQHTDVVCRVPTDADAESTVRKLDCKPPSTTEARLTRILAAATVGGVAGRGLLFLQSR